MPINQCGVVIPVIAILLPLLAAGIIAFSFLRKNNSTPPLTPEENAQESRRLGFGQIDVRTPVEVIDVRLQYNELNSPTVSIASVTRSQAYAPTYLQSNEGYSLQVLDATNTVVTATRFQIPKTFEDIAVLNSERQEGQELTLNQTEFILTLPTQRKGTSVRLLDPAGQEIATRQLAEKPSRQKKRFAGAESALASLHRFLLQPISAQTNSREFADIAIVASRYSQGSMPQFRSDALRAKNHLLTYEPFKSRSNQLKIHVVENTQDVGCNRPFSNARRGLVCNPTQVIEAVKRASVPYDVIAVIVNDSEYGGAAFPEAQMAFTYNGPQMDKIFVHEMGHAFGNLYDEYSMGEAGIIDTAAHKNCYAGSPPAQAWQGIVNSGDYAKVCRHTNWYRSSHESIMQTLQTNAFNEISRRILDASFTQYAGNRQGPGGPQPSSLSTISPSSVPSASATATPVPSATPKPSSSSVSGWVLTLRNAGCLQGQARVTFSVTQPQNVYGRVEFFTSGGQSIQAFNSLPPPGSNGTLTNLPSNAEIRAVVMMVPPGLTPGEIRYITEAFITTSNC